MTRRILGGLATVCVVGASSLALASPEEDVKATVGRWVQAFNTGNAEQIAATYTADATVYGTMAPDLAAGTEALHAYFAQAARARTQVKLLDAGTVNALSADHAVIPGLYEFSGVRPDGQAFSAPARYSFVRASPFVGAATTGQSMRTVAIARRDRRNIMTTRRHYKA